MKTSWDHLLHLTSVEEGRACWRFECNHEDPSADSPEWGTTRWPGAEPEYEDGCWFLSWWDAVGDELLDIDGPVTRMPIPVKPSDDWDYEDGGRIVFDPSFITQPTIDLYAHDPELGEAMIAFDAGRPHPFLDIKDIS